MVWDMLAHMAVVITMYCTLAPLAKDGVSVHTTKTVRMLSHIYWPR